MVSMTTSLTLEYLYKEKDSCPVIGPSAQWIEIIKQLEQIERDITILFGDDNEVDQLYKNETGDGVFSQTNK